MTTPMGQLSASNLQDETTSPIVKASVETPQSMQKVESENSSAAYETKDWEEDDEIEDEVYVEQYQ